jgi:hypothetical protein
VAGIITCKRRKVNIVFTCASHKLKSQDLDGFVTIEVCFGIRCKRLTQAGAWACTQSVPGVPLAIDVVECFETRINRAFGQFFFDAQ